jgi:hypothetical protein
MNLRVPWRVDRRGDRLPQQVGGQQPWELVEATNLADDGRHRYRHDGPIDGDKSRPQHHRDQDQSARGAEADSCLAGDVASQRQRPNPFRR